MYSLQIYWFGPLLGGIAGAKLYDVMFISSSTALQLLKSRLRRVVPRFSRPTADTTEETSADHWSSMTREDGRMWRENSLYRTRSLLVDRAVQSELTAKTVAENCLAVTVDAVNQRHSSLDDDETTPTISRGNTTQTAPSHGITRPKTPTISRGNTTKQPPPFPQGNTGETTLTISRGSVIAPDDDTLVEELHHVEVVHVHRRDSYQQAIMNSDNNGSQPTDFDVEVTASAAVDEVQPSALETVSEQEEPDVDDASKDLGEQSTAEEDETLRSSEAEMTECEKEADRTDASSTRADILDNGFEELDGTVGEEPHQTETSRSPSATVEDDLTVYDGHDPEKSRLEFLI